MKSRFLQFAIVLLEVTGVLVAAAAAVAGYGFWRLEQGPLNLSFLEPSFERAVNNQLPDEHDAEIDRIYIVKDKSDGAYDIVLEGLTVNGPDESGASRDIFTLENARFNFTTAELSRAKFYPRRIVLTRPEIDLMRGADRRFRVDYGAMVPKGAGEQTTSQTNLTKLLQKSRYFREVFERADLIDAEIRFVDVMSGRRWRSSEASASIIRTQRGLDVDVHADIPTKDGLAHIALTAALDQNTDQLSAEITMRDAPVSDLLEIFYGPSATIISAPVTGTATVLVGEDGRLQSLSLSGKAENGVAQIGALQAGVRSVVVDAKYGSAKDQFEINALMLDTDRGRIALNGTAGIVFNDDDGAPALVSFDLKGENAVVEDNDFFQSAVPIDSLSVTGRYDLNARRLDVSAMRAALLGVEAHGAVSFELAPATSPATSDVATLDEKTLTPKNAISADVTMEGALDVERLMTGWPLKAGSGARDFVKNRVIKGAVSNIHLTYYTSEASTPEGPLTLTFSVSDATVRYAPTMTPLTKASGEAVLHADKFFIDVPSAFVGPTKLFDGEVEFTSFASGAPTYFRFSTQGRVEDLLAELNRPPLEILAPAGLSPDAFSGIATARMEIMRPNRNVVALRNYQFTGRAPFKDLTVTGLAGELSLADANGVVTLTANGMRVVADALLGEDPINVDWRQRFYGAGDKTSLALSGTVSSSAADSLGIPTRQLIRGQIAFEATAKGNLSNLNAVTLMADLTDTTILAEVLGWAKPKGVAATAEIMAALNKDALSVEKFLVTGDGLEIDGGLSVSRDGRLEQAKLSRFFLEGAADLEIDAYRSEEGELRITSSGAYLNVGPILTAVAAGPEGRASDGDAEDTPSASQGFDPAAIDWGAGLRFDNRLERIELREGVQYQNATFEFWRDTERIRTFSVNATGPAATFVEVKIEDHDKRTQRRAIEARSSDVGSLLKGVFGIKSVLGGQGLVTIFLDNQQARSVDPRTVGQSAGASSEITPIVPEIISAESDNPDKDKNAEVFASMPPVLPDNDIDSVVENSVSGVVQARGMRIVGAPLLARVFSAGSWNGLAALLNGEGIDLSQAFARFSLTPEAVYLHELRASGPSVGLSAVGRVAGDADGGVRLNGAVAPAYQVNSFLGRTPLIGNLFVNREGEGLLALAYSVEGTVGTPVVTINPLSALTPGVFRRVFEPPLDDPGARPTAPESDGEPQQP